MERTHIVYVNLSGLAFLQALVGKSAPFIPPLNADHNARTSCSFEYLTVALGTNTRLCPTSRRLYHPFQAQNTTTRVQDDFIQ
jgi:hypothetical protein